MNIKDIMTTIDFPEADICCLLDADKKLGGKVREIANDFYSGKIEYKSSLEKVSKLDLKDVHE